jgi:hypothetical protein
MGVAQADESLILCSKESTKPLIQQHDQGRCSSKSEPGRTVGSEQPRGHGEVRDDTATRDSRPGKSIEENLDQTV